MYKILVVCDFVLFVCFVGFFVVGGVSVELKVL